MIFKILYTIVVLIICIIIYLNNKGKEHSLVYIIVTGIIVEIIGNFLIPSTISIFDMVDNIKEVLNNEEDILPSIKLNNNSLDLICTDEYNLKAIISPEDCNIEWNSDSKNVVNIDNNGHIKAINEGNAVITAKIIYKDNEYKDVCIVTVSKPVINLESSYSLYTGESYNLSVVTVPQNIDIIWGSSNSDIVNVNDNGTIEGMSEGMAAITATMIYNNVSYSADCAITVETFLEESDKVLNDDIGFDEQETVISETDQNSDLQESQNNTISIKDVAWLDDEKIYKDNYATTMRGEEWSDCIRFGSSNINADGTSVLRAVCDQKYSKFTAEIAPQEGFDKTETVTFYIYGGTGDVQTFKEEYQIDYSTKPFKVEIDISTTDELYFWKSGNYNQGRIAGQYINGYTGMGVLMRDATLYE